MSSSLPSSLSTQLIVYFNNNNNKISKKNYYKSNRQPLAMLLLYWLTVVVVAVVVVVVKNLTHHQGMAVCLPACLHTLSFSFSFSVDKQGNKAAHSYSAFDHIMSTYSQLSSLSIYSSMQLKDVFNIRQQCIRIISIMFSVKISPCIIILPKYL